MNTVDALNVLGKALCGDSFEVKPGLTDAETILEIAKNYTGGSGSDSGSDSGGCDIKTVTVTFASDSGTYFVTDGLTWEELTSHSNPFPPILMKKAATWEGKTYEQYIGSVWSLSGLDTSSGNQIELLGVAYTTFMFKATLSEGLPVTAGYRSVLFRKSNTAGHEGQIEVQFFNGSEPTWNDVQ